jgi:hypothetical protein
MRYGVPSTNQFCDQRLANCAAGSGNKIFMSDNLDYGLATIQ